MSWISVTAMCAIEISATRASIHISSLASSRKACLNGCHAAVPRKARPPRLAYPPLHVIRYNDRMFGYGITEHTLPDSTARVRLYSREKSIADAIHFAGRVGRDIGVEALRAYLRQPNRDVDEILRAAEVCRVSPRVTAYLEMVS